MSCSSGSHTQAAHFFSLNQTEQREKKQSPPFILSSLFLQVNHFLVFVVSSGVYIDFGAKSILTLSAALKAAQLMCIELFVFLAAAAGTSSNIPLACSSLCFTR